MRCVGSAVEPSTVEAKSGANGFPKSVVDSLVAFAISDGGTILIGVDESTGFSVAKLGDPGAIRDHLVGISRDSITPPLRIDADVVELAEGVIVATEIAPVTADLRPVYVTARGVMNGALIRTREGDRKMTQAEIALTYASRTQPTYDREPVPESGIDDLDARAVGKMLDRIRLTSSGFQAIDDETTLRRLGVLIQHEGRLVPTLGGLLALGEYPQTFFPQLIVTAVVIAADDEARFADSATFRGPIPQMVLEALAFLRRNLAARAVITGEGREDRLDYPLEAIREAVVNALMHRDYSPTTRGTQVQIELHPDRLVVRSPGGLYGNVRAEDLGDEGVSSSRNATLASLLSDTYMPASDRLVAENRASGIPSMIDAARSQGLPRPLFDSKVLSFTVTMNRSELLGPETRAWLSTLNHALPTPMHEIALAMMLNGPTNNRALREWGADRIEAGRVFHDLVEWGFALREGGRKYATYILDPSLRPAVSHARDSLETVAGVLESLGSASASTLQELTRLSRGTVVARLNQLIDQGRVEPEGAARSPQRTYVWVDAAES